MNCVLVKYKDLKLLVSDNEDMQSLIDHLPEIEDLAQRVTSFHESLLTSTREDGIALDNESKMLMSKIGYNIVGAPFSNHEAELYALNKGVYYEVLELHGNVGNKHAEKPKEKEFEQINIRVEKPLKTLAVKHVNNSEHKNLTQYIEYLIKKDLGIH